MVSDLAYTILYEEAKDHVDLMNLKESLIEVSIEKDILADQSGFI